MRFVRPGSKQAEASVANACTRVRTVLTHLAGTETERKAGRHAPSWRKGETEAYCSAK
jgi:hypothetical protein